MRTALLVLIAAASPRQVDSRLEVLESKVSGIAIEQMGTRGLTDRVDDIDTRLEKLSRTLEKMDEHRLASALRGQTIAERVEECGERIQSLERDLRFANDQISEMQRKEIYRDFDEARRKR